MGNRPMVVAGLFYPDNSLELKEMMELFFKNNSVLEKPTNRAKALILPHAGYIYSGQVAANGYRGIIAQKNQFKRIILLGPSHRCYFKGVAESGFSGFNSPFGQINVDTEAMHLLREQNLIIHFAQAHEQEHSLEVHIPFIQFVWGNEVSLIPLVVGDVDEEEIYQIIKSVRRSDDLIIVSSDLSHYLPYDEAAQEDNQTADRICSLYTDVSGYQACGSRAINGLNRYATSQLWQARLVDLKNSGDASGDMKRVVGYGAFAYH